MIFRTIFGLLLTAATAFATALQPCSGGEPDQAAKPALAPHPRLLFTDARVARLKTDEGRAQVIKLAQNNKLPALCLAYRVTGDKLYAEKVRDKLLQLCRIPESRNAQTYHWDGGLGGAHHCFDVALGLDSIYDFLSPEERKTISSALVEFGIKPMLDEWLLGETRIHALDTMGHNWWSACVFLPGVAALAVADEEPRARQWLDDIARDSVQWFTYPGSVLENKPANFDGAGGFYESVGYMNYGLSQYLIFRMAWENSFGNPLPEIPLLHRAGDFFLNASYPESDGLLSLNFGDSSLHADGSQPLAWLWAEGFRKPEYLWYLKLTANSRYKESMNRDSAFGLVYYPSETELAKAPETPDLPLSAIYRDMGWAMMRDSWKPGATFLGVKSGFTWNHAHADAGSFILFHKGENFIIDSGSCWYGNPRYDEYYRRSRAHNVVLFNGEGENPEDAYFGSKFPGSVEHLVDAGSLKYVLADATGPVSRNFIRNYRNFLWIGNVILIIDDLKTYEDGRFEWLLHAGGAATRKGLDLNIQCGKTRIAVRPLFPETFPVGFPHDQPEKMALEEMTGYKDHAQNTPEPYYAITPPGKARVTKFVTAIILDPDNPPELERLEANNTIGVRIREAGKTTEVYLNLLADGRYRHRNAVNTLGGWETDAYLLAVTSEAGNPPSRFFIADGSFLRCSGQLLFNSIVKAFAVIERGKTTVYPK